MLCRASCLLSRVPLAPFVAAVVGKRFMHTYVAADECILKKDEVYQFTDTGRWWLGSFYRKECVILTWSLVPELRVRKVASLFLILLGR